jgi:hypothetical protein
VNIQETTAFESHRLNRDTWSDKRLMGVLQSDFVFWQQAKDSEPGAAFFARYTPAGAPLVCIIDPRTRQMMAHWVGFVEANKLRLLLVDFLEENDITSFGPVKSSSSSSGSSGRSKRPRPTDDAHDAKRIKRVHEMTDEEQLAAALSASLEVRGVVCVLPASFLRVTRRVSVVSGDSHNSLSLIILLTLLIVTIGGGTRRGPLFEIVILLLLESPPLANCGL